MPAFALSSRKGNAMNQFAPIGIASDPYFHDIIREMETIEPKALDGNVGRRQFLKLAGGASAGLVLAFSVGGFAKSAEAATNAAGEAVFNAYIRIAPSGAIILYNKAPEIGQGIKTSFPMILAEHLDADWADVKIEQAPINPAVYGRQSAGGSRSTRPDGSRIAAPARWRAPCWFLPLQRNGAFPNPNSRLRRAPSSIRPAAGA